jgi:hypothetical protein
MLYYLAKLCKGTAQIYQNVMGIIHPVGWFFPEKSGTAQKEKEKQKKTEARAG